MELIDVGCNLAHDAFDADRAEVLAHARQADVVQIVVTGASEDGSIAALELARAHPGELFATTGVHPHHASDFCADTESLMRDLSSKAGVVAIGETGLDYFRDIPARGAAQGLERQLQVALLWPPLFLHQRCARISSPLRQVDRVKPRGTLFTGTREELCDCLDSIAMSGSQAGLRRAGAPTRKP
jgi:TatD DNase family protein